MHAAFFSPVFTGTLLNIHLLSFLQTALINPENTHAFGLLWVFCLSDPSNTWCAVFLSFPPLMFPSFLDSPSCVFLRFPHPATNLCALVLSVFACHGPTGFAWDPWQWLTLSAQPFVALVVVLFVKLCKVVLVLGLWDWAFESKPFVCLRCSGEVCLCSRHTKVSTWSGLTACTSHFVTGFLVSH